MSFIKIILKIFVTAADVSLVTFIAAVMVTAFQTFWRDNVFGFAVTWGV
jgi:hypothetical protein